MSAFKGDLETPISARPVVAALLLARATPVKSTLLKLLLVAATAGSAVTAAPNPPPSDADAQRAHAQGTCGTLGPGTGLSANKGWVVSMLPGRHEFRVRGGGTALVTVARKSAIDFDAGRPYYIVLEGAAPDAILEWKVPGSDWGAVSKLFLYPLQK